MRATLTDGREVVIHFRHHNNKRLFRLHGTTCSFRVVLSGEHGDEFAILAEGLSMVSPKDTYCKETGRKVSLAKALRKFSKEDRKRIWKAYHGRRNFTYKGYSCIFDGGKWSVLVGRSLVLHALTRAGIIAEIDSVGEGWALP